MIRPELVPVWKYHIKCPYCNYEWDSETKSLKRVTCSKCKISLCFEPEFRREIEKQHKKAIAKASVARLVRLTIIESVFDAKIADGGDMKLTLLNEVAKGSIFIEDLQKILERPVFSTEFKKAAKEAIASLLEKNT